MAVVHQVVREREAGRPHAHHEDLAAGGGARERSAEVQRIPAREQRVDLESPRQVEDVLQRARLRLRDVDRLLLLIDAGLHAVVADAVAGGCHHRVVDDDGGERADRHAFALQLLELGDALLERTAGQRHAEHGLLEAERGILLGQAVRARILALLVTPDAVVGLTERAGEIGTGVGQRETFAAAQVVQAMQRDAVARRGCERHEALEIELLRCLEQHAGGVALLAGRRVRRPGGIAQGEVQRRRVGGFVLLPGEHAASEREFGERFADGVGQLALESGPVQACRRVGLDLVHRLALHEQALHRVERGESVMALRQRADFATDPEQFAQEVLHVGSEFEQQGGFLLRVQGRRVEPRFCHSERQRRVEPGQRFDERPVEALERLRVVEVGEAKAESELQGVRDGHAVRRWAME